MTVPNFLLNVIQDILAGFSIFQNYFKRVWNKLSRSKQQAIAPLRKALDGLTEELIIHPDNAEQASALIQGVIELIVRDISETE